MRELLKRYRPADYAFTVYHILVIALLLIFGIGKVGNVWFYILRDLAFLIAGLLLIRYWTPERKNIILTFLRNFYPFLIFPFNYKDMGQFAFMIVPELQDHFITTFELWIFNTHPTWWLESHLNFRWLNELVNIGYTSYYLMFPLLSVIIFYFKKDKFAFGHLLFTLAVSFYIHYLIFILFPVDGPWRYAPVLDHFSGPIEGYLFVPLQRKIMAAGVMEHSGCFPSSHVAAAFVVTLNARKFVRKLFYPFAVILFLMFFATFFLRYHYITDAVVGLLFGGFLYSILGRIYTKWTQAKDFH